jgi:hypothetical protein
MTRRTLRCHPAGLVAAWSALGCAPGAVPGAGTSSTGSSSTGEAEPIAMTGPTSTGPGGPLSTSGTAADPSTTSTTSGSTGSTGPAAMCGDGALDDGEQCDLGGENRDDGACTLDCKAAACGDGLVWSGTEACDDGADNGNHYGGCSDDCTLNPRCGDSVLDVQLGEDCDYGDDNGTGEGKGPQGPCTDGCKWDGRMVFLSSLLYTGDLRDGELAGLAGADAKCKTHAWAAGMQRWQSFRAWLSDGQFGPLDRFTAIPVRPLLLPNGELVAPGLSELVLAGSGEGIRVDEFGAPLPPSWVWTNTGVTGEPASADGHCNNWSAAAPDLIARVGLSHRPHEPEDLWKQWSTEKHWTSRQWWECSELARLYCVEQ